MIERWKNLFTLGIENDSLIMPLFFSGESRPEIFLKKNLKAENNERTLLFWYSWEQAGHANVICAYAVRLMHCARRF